MSIVKTLILGRENGIRSKLRGALFGGDSGGDKGTSRASASASRPVPAEAALGLQPEAPKDVTPPDGYEVVLHKDALKVGKVVEIIIAGRAIAVANVDGEFYACTNSCPHADGPLGEGALSGSILTCPYHGWAFDLVDGSCGTNADVKLETYSVKIEKDAVCVKL